MKIRNITLERFRSYKESVPIQGFSDVNVFIGPNNAGKSNVVEAFKYLCNLLRGQVKSFRELVFDRQMKSDFRLSLCFILASRERSRLIGKLFENNSSVKADDVKKSPFLETLTYSVIIKENGIVREEIKTPNLKSGEIVIIKAQEAGGITKSESLNLEGSCNKLSGLTNIESSFRKLGQGSVGWKPLSFSNLSRSESTLVGTIRRSMNKCLFFPPIRQVTPRMESGEEATLSPQGNNLTKFMNSVQSSNPRRFISVVDEIIKILPTIKEVLAPLKQKQATLTVEEEGLTTPTEVGDVSFGLMQILVIVVGIITKEDDSAIFIEEPELHLHAASQRKLFKLIQREAEKKQFFITTHSSIFTGCTNKISTFLVTKRGGATNVRKIIEPSELKLIKNALGHRNTDLFGYECVVFLEGDSEQLAFPIIAEAIGHDLIERGIHLVNIRGKGKVSKIAEYLEYLKDSDVLAYIIADGDKQVKERLDDWARQDLLQKDCQAVWELEFEDCFKLDMIVEAMKEVAKEKGFEFDTTPEDLKENIPAGKSVVKALEKLMYQKELPSLDKPALSENLALLLKEEIEKGSPARQKTLPEQVLEKIVEMVEARREHK